MSVLIFYFKTIMLSFFKSHNRQINFWKRIWKRWKRSFLFHRGIVNIFLKTFKLSTVNTFFSLLSQYFKNFLHTTWKPKHVQKETDKWYISPGKKTSTGSATLNKIRLRFSIFRLIVIFNFYFGFECCYVDFQFFFFAFSAKYLKMSISFHFLVLSEFCWRKQTITEQIEWIETQSWRK